MKYIIIAVMSFCFTGCQLVDEALSKDGEVSENQVSGSPDNKQNFLSEHCTLRLDDGKSFGDVYKVREILRLHSGSSIHKAAFEEDEGEVEELIAKGTDVNSRDQYGRTALHWVTYFNHDFSDGDDDMVELLLEKRADPNVQDVCGNTPLHYIAEKKAGEIFGSDVDDIANYLLEAGARLDITNKKEGLTSYDVAVASSQLSYGSLGLNLIASSDLVDEFNDWIEEQKEKENE